MFITIFSLIVLFLSMVIHEFAHGSVAYSLGDPTAKYAGRLTLNPLQHIDLFGTIILPILCFLLTFGQGPMFLIAKPVPINPYNLRDQKRGIIKVSLAGPATNFLLAVFFGLLIRFFSLPLSLSLLFSIIVIYNFLWGLFNLVPLPPLDGSHILFSFLPERFWQYRLILEQNHFLILILFIFGGGLKLLFWGAVTLYFLVSGQPLTGF